MKGYFDSLKKLVTNWKGVPIILLTIARLYYGYSWFKGGLGKLGWLSDGELNSVGYISRMVENMSTDHGDPFKLGRMMAKVADTIFISAIPQVTDVLVVVLEIGIGLLLIVGFRLFWVILCAVFLNLQFFAAGSTNNFGYMIVNLTIWKWTSYFDVIGLDGYLRFKKGKPLL